MKTPRLIIVLALNLLISSAFSQGWAGAGMRTILKDGDFSVLKDQNTVLLKFTYENMLVGKYTEEKYVEKKKGEYNEKDPGRGDEWAGKWVAARNDKYEPMFVELFNERMAKGKSKLMGGEDKKDSKYLLTINTIDTEPGWNVGVSRMPGYVSVNIKLSEVGSPGTVLAEAEILRAPAQGAMGFDFDVSGRIGEGYAKLGKELATWFTKKDWGNK